MGLLGVEKLLTLPAQVVIAPIRGTVRVAEIVQQEVYQQVHSKANVSSRLEAVEEAQRRGEIGEAEVHERQAAILAQVGVYREAGAMLLESKTVWERQRRPRRGRRTAGRRRIT